MAELKCPQCGSTNTTGPNDELEATCLDCGKVFDVDEITKVDQLRIPHISIYMKFTKKFPKTPGLRSTDFSFAKDNPERFDVLVGMFAAVLSEFFLQSASMSLEQINEAIQRAAKQVADIKWEEKDG